MSPMNETFDNLPNDVAALQAIIFSLKNETIEYKKLNDDYQSTIKHQANEIIYLTEQVKLLNHKLFGRRSEKLAPEEDLQGRLFDEAEAHSGDEAAKKEEVIRVSGHTRRKGGRRPLPPELPRVEEVHDISPEEKKCTCGHELVRIGEEISEKLDIIPAQMRVLRIVRPKYACKNCEGIESEGEEGAVKVADMPPQIIPQGIATPGLLAYIFTGKFCDGLPLYRLEKIFSRIGIDLPRSTMCGWPIDIHLRYSGFFDLFREELRFSPLIGIDETTVQVLEEPGRKNTTKSYMWVFRGGGAGRSVILYHYAPTRSPSEIERYISDYKGYIQTDGYVGYEALGRREGIVLVGCWAHTRRNFYDAAKCAGEGAFANTVVDLIRKLYAVEDEGRDKKLSYDEIKYLRQEKAKPILESIKGLLDSKVHNIAPKSLTGKAIRYALERWSTLLVYLSDGRIPIDNNQLENAIRPFVIGRKNWLFSGSPRGAAASAVMYSLIETAKANGIEPYWYLRYLFEKLPFAKTKEELRMLLPNVIDLIKIEESRMSGAN